MGVRKSVGFPGLVENARARADGESTVVRLLEKVSFSREDGDHLIFTGDLINKGPDSAGVVDLARELKASSVRGNHEDRILLHREDIEASKNSSALESGNKDNAEFFSSKELDERALARSFSKEQIEWLNSCPVILNVGQVPTMGQVVVVHAGLVPGVELEKQDPSTVMTMRSIDKKTHVPSSEPNGVKWDKVNHSIK
jgi:3',5'-cyclic AMP phosphodiesterase CpdA